MTRHTPADITSGAEPRRSELRREEHHEPARHIERVQRVARIPKLQQGIERRRQVARDLANDALLQPAQRKAQEVELILRRCEQEIALVARRIDRAVQFGAGGSHDAPDIMAGRQTIPTQIARDGEEIGELWPHIAAHAGDGGAPGQIIIGKLFDHRLTKGADMVDNMVNKTQPLRDLCRIANILPRAARARAARRAIAVIQAQRNADDIGARTRGKRGNHA